MGRGGAEKVAMEVEDDKSMKIKPSVLEAVKEAKETVEKDGTQLDAAIEKLLTLERVHRLAAEAPETSLICVTIIQLCFSQSNWKALMTNITLLSKRRAQMKQAVTKMVQEAITYIPKAPNDEIKMEYLTLLRTVTEGKIFVELERARITRTIAEMKEAAGDVVGAADIMQDMQVETYGTMDRREKTDFILEQVRLCLLKKDYIRAGIMSKKVTNRTLAATGIDDLILRHYALLIRIKLYNKEYLEVCRCYLARYSKESIQADENLYLQELKLATLFLILSKRDPMQQDLLHQVKAYKVFEKLPSYREILKLFTTVEIIQWEHFKKAYGEELSSLVASADYQEEFPWETALHDRITEHNLRVVSTYFSRLRLKRLAELLDLSEEDTEERVTRLVSDEKAMWAKIDRPAGIVAFAKPQAIDSILNEWAESVSKLLDIVEQTCHLVHKEHMIHGIET